VLKILPRTNNLVDRLALYLATLGPAGRMPKAPGTWGSFAALLLSPFVFLPLPIWGRVLTLLIIFPLGAWCATRAECIIGHKDPSCVVVDELWGQWIVLLFMESVNIYWFVFAFFLFRLFDIIKPWPVRASEDWLPRGWGIMIDDGLAGLYALAMIMSCKALF